MKLVNAKKQLSYLMHTLIFVLIITISFISVEQIYRIYNPILNFNLSLKTFLEVFLINFFILSLKNLKAIKIIYGFFIFLNFMQLIHFSYYGTWIFPIEYILFLTQFYEAMETFMTVLEITYIPILLNLVLLVIIYVSLSKIKEERFVIPYVNLILILVIIFIPLRVYIKDSKHGARPNMDKYPIRNFILTLGYLGGSILPKKIFSNSKISQAVVATPIILEKSPDVNVILVMGESLNRNFMSLYGYEIDTTPFLNNLKNNENFIYKKGISSGVLTDISLPSFFNMIIRPDSTEQIVSTNTCLFRMAKDNGFVTSFYTAQARDSLSNIKSYMCTRWIDNYLDGTDETGHIKESSYDNVLPKRLEGVDFNKSNFVVLHQIGSHSPFNARYPASEKVYSTPKNTNRTMRDVIEYQNTVRYTDKILAQIINVLKQKSNKPTYVIFTSDHSTVIGKEGKAGHGRIGEASVYEVPFFVYALHDTKTIQQYFNEFEYISHYEISKLIAFLLGYEIPQICNWKDGYYVCDSDISGLAGYLKLEFKDDSIQRTFYNQ